MKIAVIGTGYVGLVSGACFSEFGVEVVCVDKDKNKIEQLKSNVCPIYEPGLENLVASNMGAGRLSFTTDLVSAVKGADAVFIAVGTPSRSSDGHADLSYVFSAAREIARVIDGYTVIVTKSTVPVGTGFKIKSIVSDIRPDADFDIASNPEFLREGAAISDFMGPDRVVIGVESKRAASTLNELYRPLQLRKTPIVLTTLETAELTKYAANTFLATKLTFINEIADLCEKVGANVQDLAHGIGLDDRIGSKFLQAGPGYGGSCFPKDTHALVQTAKDAGAPVRIVETVVDINEKRKTQMVEKVVSACGGSIMDKTIAVLGLTFKANTDDMRESPSLVIIPELQNLGASVKAFDPKGMRESANLFEEVSFFDEPYEMMRNADAIVILTEWDLFRSLDLERVKGLIKTPTLVDLRNIYNLDEMERAGFNYFSVGRKGIVTN